MFRRIWILVASCAILLAFRGSPLETSAAAQNQQDISPSAMAQINALLAEKASRSGVELKIDPQILNELHIWSGQAWDAGLKHLSTSIEYRPDFTVTLDIKARVTAQFLSTLRSLGAEIVDSVPDRQAVRVNVGLDRVELIASLPDVIFIHPKQDADVAGTGQGSRTSEGDAAHNAAAARALYGVNGTGIKIGVLSDGVSHLSSSQSLGDLAAVTVLPGQAGSGDEGTAMLEIIHDLAPGAQLYFATGFGGTARFAQNIRDLRAAGCDIIVDDLLYYVEAPFQDGQAPSVRSTSNGGIVAQAVKDVTSSGALYFSSAGNSGSHDLGTSGTWEGDFVDGGQYSVFPHYRMHRFGSQTYDVVTAASGPIYLFWNDPLGAAANDYDVFVLDSTGTNVIQGATAVQNGTQDPYEYVGYVPTGSRIVILNDSSSARFLHLTTNRGRLQIETAGATHGHNATTAGGAFGVGATPAYWPWSGSGFGPYPNPFNSANRLEAFSSDGPRRLFFRDDGSPFTPGNLTASGGVLLNKPDITAADGVSVTGVGGFPSTFYGTSAAAPHAAAIAALLKSKYPWLSAAQARNALVNSAIDIHAPGVDRDSGAGIVMADRALASIVPPSISLTSTTVSRGASIAFTVTNGPANISDWVGLCPAAGADASCNIAWSYLGGLKTRPASGVANATLQFTAPATPGDYNVRWFANDGWTKMATSATVTVSGPSALTINDVSVTEGNSGSSNATFTVTLSPANNGQTVTVDYVTSNGTATTTGGDYVAASGTLTFPPGTTSRPLTVSVSGDTTFESDETFTVNLSNAVNAAIGDAQGLGTVANDDARPAPTVTVSSTSVAAGHAIDVTVANGLASIGDWVGLCPAAGADSSCDVAWSYLNGLKTRPAVGIANGTLQLTAPATSGSYNVRWFANDGWTKLATSATVTVTGLPSLIITDAVTVEGNSGSVDALFMVLLSSANDSQTVTVDYATSDGTATTAGGDYVAASGTLTFPPGALSRPLRVALNGDTTFESDETFTVNLSNALNAVIGDAQGLGTIVNDDASPPATVTVSPTLVAPGHVIDVTVANGPANISDWVGVCPAAGADSSCGVAWGYLNGLKTRPAAGIANGTLQFTAPAAPGAYNVRWFANDGWTKLATSATVTVTSTPALTINDVTMTEGNSGTASATFTVTLSPTNDTQTVTVDYATFDGTATTADGDYAPASGTLTFAPGTAMRTVTVAIMSDTTIEPDETFGMALSNAVNALLGDDAGIATITHDDADPNPVPRVTLPLPSVRVNVGDHISFTVDDGPGNISDWVALCPMGGADASCGIVWSYLNGLRTRPSSGITHTTLQFTAPAAIGSYDVRLFASDGWTRLAATSGTVTVTEAAPMVMIDISPVSPGSLIDGSVSYGPANVGDWVGLYEVGANDASVIDWSYLNLQKTRPATGLSFATVWFTAPLTPGLYELRLFLNDSWTLLATSRPLTVQ